MQDNLFTDEEGFGSKRYVVLSANAENIDKIFGQSKSFKQNRNYKKTYNYNQDKTIEFLGYIIKKENLTRI